MSSFGFLLPDFPPVHDAAERAAQAAYPDPRTACFYARRALELAVAWAFKHDPSLKLPYQDNLSALIHEPTFQQTAGAAIFTKARLITKLGNEAVHRHGPVAEQDALTAVRELFHVCYWFARSYGRTSRPPAMLVFNPAALPRTAPIPKQTLAQLQQLATDLRARDEKLAEVLADRNALDEELKRLRAEIAEVRRAAAATPDEHDYSEAETRDAFIDLLLREAGWTLDQPRDREFPVTGMPNEKGEGFVDYVLWGDDGLPLGVVEAKRTRRDARVGQHQAKLYADCLEAKFGQRPLIFYTNGYEHWLWDDRMYPPRPVQGFLKKDELQLAIQRRNSRLSLAAASLNRDVVDRPYQERAIRRIGEAFERHRSRRALLVMATGAGKTRTVIALCDLLMRCNWAKRILFLADRVALVNQAVNAFKTHLAEASPVNLVKEKTAQGRVYVSTYPTMMGLIDESADGRRQFGVGHFDLVVIDEAHRSVYQKYRAIFEYFDSLLVGLTATPRDEVDRNTYELFHLEDGVPTDAYDIQDAVRDEFLVPPRAVSVPLRFPREGLRYDDRTPEEREQWDLIEWNDEGEVPDRVEAEAVNRWLFNTDTVDKMLRVLMERGLKVDAGDKLGKTIIFAKSELHAQFIRERFDRNYPHYAGSFAQVITFKTEYAQSLIDAFSDPARRPQIAISVDMLDTGIDVPDVVNLVFFKLVRSRTKFWQMLGRGTRLRKDLFGPGKHKEFFFVFDFCGNFEFFQQNPQGTEGATGTPLGERLFLARLELIAELDAREVAEDDPGRRLRQETAGILHELVAAMNLDNFIVRPKRRYVERYREIDAWRELGPEQRAELAQHVAGLPTEIEDPDIDARQFDYLMLRLQLALLRSEPAFRRLQEAVRETAALLAEKASIPMVFAQMALIEEIQTDGYWQDVTAPMLELARRRLRSLIRLIEKSKRQPVYTNFEDEIGELQEIDIQGVGGATFARFRERARAFLRSNENDPAIQKLRRNEPLTPEDLAELERILLRAGIGTAEDLRQAREASEGFGLFLRCLSGLDREAAKRAFADFLNGRRATANQIEFIDMVINHLTEEGYVDPAVLYASPFTDVNARGVEGVFAPPEVNQIVGILSQVRATAAAVGQR